MDFATFHDHDIETWAELQVAALRRLAERPGPWSNVIDWENVIEEIESLGRERLRLVESLLRQVFVHLLKLDADPTSLAAGHQRGEAAAFLKRAQARAGRSELLAEDFTYDRAVEQLYVRLTSWRPTTSKDERP